MPIYQLKVRRIMEEFSEAFIDAPSAEKAVDRWLRRTRNIPEGSQQRQHGLCWSKPAGPSYSVTHVAHRDFFGTEYEQEVFREVPEQWNIDSYSYESKG